MTFLGKESRGSLLSSCSLAVGPGLRLRTSSTKLTKARFKKKKQFFPSLSLGLDNDLTTMAGQRIRPSGNNPLHCSCKNENISHLHFQLVTLRLSPPNSMATWSSKTSYIILPSALPSLSHLYHLYHLYRQKSPQLLFPITICHDPCCFLLSVSTQPPSRQTCFIRFLYQLNLHHVKLALSAPCINSSSRPYSRHG